MWCFTNKFIFLDQHKDQLFFEISIYLFFSKNGKVQKRGKLNLIGRLQLSTEKSKEEDNEGIMQLRILRVQVCSQFVLFCRFFLFKQHFLFWILNCKNEIPHLLWLSCLQDTHKLFISVTCCETDFGYKARAQAQILHVILKIKMLELRVRIDYNHVSFSSKKFY